MIILRKIMLVIIILVVSGCSSIHKPYMGTSYKSKEHEGRRHTTEELREECRRTGADINYLNSKIKSVKGPGSADIIAQAKRDIDSLEGKFSEAGCDDILSRPPQPNTDERRHKGIQPAAKEIKRGALLSFDECFQKCKELTDRTNGECFDACLK